MESRIRRRTTRRGMQQCIDALRARENEWVRVSLVIIVIVVEQLRTHRGIIDRRVQTQQRVGRYRSDVVVVVVATAPH